MLAAVGWNRIPNIYRIWREPTIAESFEPERISRVLPLKKAPIKTTDKRKSVKAKGQCEEIIAYLTIHVSAKNSDLAKLLDLKPTRVQELLKGLVAEGIVVAEGDRKNRIYKLKSLIRRISF